MDNPLPSELAHGAILRDREYAWQLSAFPRALEIAPTLGYACLGGQFWFMLPDNTLYEPFWLEANSEDQAPGESWPAYANRSCSEVQLRFHALVNETDYKEEARKFESFAAVNESGELNIRVLFNAYFVTEQELDSLALKGPI
jgi:hypothetical protein